MEEDIKILEEYLKSKYNECSEDFYDSYCITTKEKQAIENLIKGYRELEEKNKQILNAKIGIDLSYDEYIEKSKVKEKIEQLQESKEFAYRDEEIMFKKAIQVLQELMEDN